MIIDQTKEMGKIMETLTVKSLEKMINLYEATIRRMATGHDSEMNEMIAEILLSMILSNEYFIERNCDISFNILDEAILINSHKCLTSLSENRDGEFIYTANFVFLKIFKEEENNEN